MLLESRAAGNATVVSRGGEAPRHDRGENIPARTAGAFEAFTGLICPRCCIRYLSLDSKCFCEALS